MVETDFTFPKKLQQSYYKIVWEWILDRQFWPKLLKWLQTAKI